MLLRSFVPVGRYREDPFTVMRTVQNDIDRAFGLSAAKAEAARLHVRLDVHEDEKSYYVSADLPGFDENSLDMTFDEGVLTLKGEKKIERSDTKDTWHITERAHGSFERQITLPPNVDATKIEATFEKGVLKVSLPKLPPEPSTSKKINIKAA